MKPAKPKPQLLYEKLERNTQNSILVVLFAMSNLFLFKISVSNEIIGVSITMFSIIYGFLVSSVCNLFGRNITRKLSDTETTRKDSTELLEFRTSIIRFITRGVVFVFVSIMIFLVRQLSLGSFTFVIYGVDIILLIKLLIHGYYISQLLFITYSMYYYFIVLINMLVNETYLSK